MIYEDDKVRISWIIVGGKKELAFDYFKAGYSIGRVVTSELYDMNLINVSLAE